MAVWVFGLAGSSAKTATLNVQAMGLSIGSTSSTLTLVLSDLSSSSIGINGFTLGGLTCTFSTPIAVPSGTQGVQLIIIFNAGSNGSPASGNSAVSSVTFNNNPAGTPTCTGSVTLTPGVQYSGELTTTSGQTYPFTVSS